MQSHRRLARLFHAAASTFGLASVAGCGGIALSSGNADSGMAPGNGNDAGTFTQNVCDGAEYRPLSGVTPGLPVDYLELRREEMRQAGSVDPAPYLNVTAKEGTACKTATNAPKCTSDLAALRTQAGWQSGSGGDIQPTYGYLAFTRGDTIGTVTTLDALSAFVAPVDNVKDAALLVSAREHRIVCDANNGRPTKDGYELLTQTGSTCGSGTGLDQHVVHVSKAGVVAVVSTVRIKDGDPHCQVGRRPEGLAQHVRAPGSVLGSYFAEIAHLEAASVLAFEKLARELEAHGAPARLVRGAERARADEVRHARTTSKLATRAGGIVAPPIVAESPVRSLLEIARENAVEGCVRETFGALVATVQARSAGDRAVSRAMRGIAKDETRHAALAWDVAEWIDAKLTPRERAEVAEARQDAVSALRRDLFAELPQEVCVVSGVPSGREAVALFDAVAPELWAA